MYKCVSRILKCYRVSVLIIIEVQILILIVVIDIIPANFDYN